MTTTSECKAGLFGLMVAALGVVYGDIGTSPLYTLKEVFSPTHGIPVTPENVMGILSLVFWSLLMVVSLKYITFVLRANNHGEGGVIALLALTLHSTRGRLYQHRTLMVFGLLGAGLFYGDGAITPAISVLSAVEGLEIAQPGLKPFVLPLVLIIIFFLFLFQRQGTAKVGNLFGPIMIFWFFILACLGLNQVIAAPEVLKAMDPLYAILFIKNHPGLSFVALGAVFLALTGAEALYADMGHFGGKPIRFAWFSWVFPALVLNYFGQGALLLANPAAIANPFYLLVPQIWLYPLIVLSTIATIIASQAVISGAFSMTHQAIKLGYLPRMTVIHTSESEIGQVYLPMVNWTLLIAVIGLVLFFRSSDNLASAYGIAVTMTMVITTAMTFKVTRSEWKWPLWRSLLVVGVFLIIDLAFLSANAVKILDGGWLPLLFAASIFFIMMTWRGGCRLLSQRMHQDSMPLEPFIEQLWLDPPLRVPGTAVFMTSDYGAVPRALLHNLMHNKVLHQRVVVLTVDIEAVPHIPVAERAAILQLPHNFYVIYLRFGFKDDPNVPLALLRCKTHHLELDFNLMECSFFLGRETLIPAMKSEMSPWREKIFLTMFRNVGSATTFFRLPANRVVELGTQIEL